MVGLPGGVSFSSVHLRTPTAETGRKVQVPFTCEIPQGDLF
jgi:hypothetical protein